MIASGKDSVMEELVRAIAYELHELPVDDATSVERCIADLLVDAGRLHVAERRFCEDGCPGCNDCDVKWQEYAVLG